MNLLYVSAAVTACFDNDNDAFIPEVWAQMGLVILEENMVMANLVHRDFEQSVKQFGDTVNTRRPGRFRTKRKRDGQTLSNQDASAVNVQVPLDQWFYTSFTINDGEASKSFQELVDIYLVPGMQTIARSVDRAVLGRCHEFLGGPTSRVGRLGNLLPADAKDTVLEARELLNTNLAYMNGRNLVLSPSAESALLKNELFIRANERGDGGVALENARLGHILGFETYMDQNVNSMSIANADIVTGTVTNAKAAATGGTQAVTVNGYEVVLGEFATVAGNDQPTHITAATASTNTTAVTFNENNKYATLANAVITVYKSCDVKGNYDVGHEREIVLDQWTKAPQTGQLVAFGTGANRRVYTIIESYLSAVGEQSVMLDRPLELALSDGDAAFPGPAGSFNWAFHREAVALVTRPLALPNQQLGVRSNVGVYNDLAMRVTMQYDINQGGTVVNLDILAGVAKLDNNLCVILQA